MSVLSKKPRLRRTIAMAAAALSIAGSVTLTTAGTAGAASAAPSCGPAQGPWYGWALAPCVREISPGVYQSYVVMTGGDTDVRVYTGVYNKCDGVTYGIPGDSAANHVYPNGGATWYFSNSTPYINCPAGVWGIARITNNGVGSPWAWSTAYYG